MKPKHLDVGEIVQISWFDAQGDSGWEDPDKGSYDPHDILSVGAVLHANERALTVCQSIDLSGGSVDNRITVPWVNIVSVDVL